MTALQVPLADGRVLDARVHGRDGAPLVLVQHGTPGGAALPAAYRAAADALGVRLVAWARPGYGGSTRRPGRSVADVVPDALAVADALGADRFATTGGSGGGPHALAVGALAGDRCLAVATVAGVAPWAAKGLAFLDGMGEDNHVEFGAAVQGEAALRPLLGAWRDELVTGGPEAVLTGLEGLLGAPDRAVLSGALAEEVHAGFAAALAPGIDGWLDDDLAFVRPWGFAPRDLRVPVAVWQGEQDLMVPPAHGRWLAARLPGAAAHLLPEEGHLSLHVTRVRDVLAPLAAALS